MSAMEESVERQCASGHSEIDLLSVDQLAVCKWHTSKHVIKRPNVIKNRLQMAVAISIGTAILNAVLLPEVALIGSGTSHYFIVAIPLLLAFPVGLISGVVSK